MHPAHRYIILVGLHGQSLRGDRAGAAHCENVRYGLIILLLLAR